MSDSVTKEKEMFVEDSNGNRCDAEYFGSMEAAQKALDSLKDCRFYDTNEAALEHMRKLAEST